MKYFLYILLLVCGFLITIAINTREEKMVVKNYPVIVIEHRGFIGENK